MSLDELKVKMLAQPANTNQSYTLDELPPRGALAVLTGQVTLQRKGLFIAINRSALNVTVSITPKE